MTKPEQNVLRCAIYTRKSTEHNLDLEFNSLDAQREDQQALLDDVCPSIDQGGGKRRGVTLQKPRS